MNKNIRMTVLGVTLACITTLITAAGCKSSPPTSDAPPSTTNTATAGHGEFYVDTNGIVYLFGNPVSPATVGQGLQVAATAGATYAVSQDTNAAAYFKAAVVALDLATANGDYSPTNLQETLSAISINEVHSASTQAAISGVLSEYNLFFGAVVNARLTNSSPYLQPAFTGLRNGFAAVVGD